MTGGSGLPTIDTSRARDGVIADQPLLQDPYSIRCAPQIYGAVLDVLDWHDRIVTTELNSVTDNPLFFAADEEVLHGGNFYGQHIGFVSDALHMAVVKVAAHVERKIARITDPVLSKGLPAFLQPHRTGLQSGFMGAQVTASAILAEMRSEAMPASIQSIATNANNQDVVPMGTIAARKARRALDHLFRLLAIDAMVMVQAMELRGSGFSPAAVAGQRWLRKTVPALEQDRPLGAELEKLALRLSRTDASRPELDQA
jgi:tyrosine ammonia-lyase